MQFCLILIQNISNCILKKGVEEKFVEKWDIQSNILIILVLIRGMAFIIYLLWLTLDFSACELLKLDSLMRYVYLNSVQTEFPFPFHARAHIECSRGL
jgi:hypothetical protein